MVSGLVLITPFVFLLYLVLGLSLWVAIGLAVLLAVLQVPLGVVLIVGIVLYVLAWIGGSRMERRLSQLKPYRLVRGIVRMVAPVALVIGMLASNDVSGPAMALTMLAIVPFHLLCRLFDRLYFPVWSEVAKKAAMVQQGFPDSRPMGKRVFYALC